MSHRLTRATRRAIEAALYDARRARDYIMAPSTAVCIRGTMATTTLHYTRGDGAVLYEEEREYGSDLCGLSDAIRRLEALLAPTPG